MGKAKQQGQAATLDKDAIHELLAHGWIHCRIIVELLGGPKEYIAETMQQYAQKIKENEAHNVLTIDVAPVEPQDKLWSTFAEIELWVKDASTLAFLCFDYMPSSIEIIEPENFHYRAADFAAFFNDLQARLHKLDMIVKELRAENKVLQINGSRLLRNNVLISLKEKDKDLKTLAQNVGLVPEQLAPFLDAMIREDYLKKIGDAYTVK